MIVLAIVLVIITTAIQINNFVNPNLKQENQDSVIWKLIMFILPIVNILIAAVLQIIDLKNEKKNHSNSELIFTSKFSTYIEKKNEILCNLQPSAYPEEVMRQCLHLITDCLKEYIGKKHYFEVSIFTDISEPYIYTYYDTHGNNKPSSYMSRKKNPKYYIEEKYEVIELLNKPSSEIFVIPSTKEYTYNFVNKKQKKHISSQLMYCFHMEDPYVLVITCSKSKAFDSNDFVLKNFIQSIGRILNSDILIKEYMCCKNNFQCNVN